VTFELDGKPNLTNCSKGQYWLTIERQLEGYHHEDPLAWAKLAMPIKVVNHIHVIGNVKATEKMRAVGDMCLMAFYFLFQVGKYTQYKKMQTGIQHSQAVSCQGYHILGQKTVHHPE
jgi:hypothetical protein